MWPRYFLRRDNGAVVVSKRFFWRCMLGYLGDLSQSLQLPLTWPDVKITGSGCWAYGCSLCHSVTFPVVMFFTVETLRKQTRPKFHLFREAVCLQVSISLWPGTSQWPQQGQAHQWPGQEASSGLKLMPQPDVSLLAGAKYSPWKDPSCYTSS